MAALIYITYIEKEGPYVKIWGQTDKAFPTCIEKTLQQVTTQFDQGQCVLPPENYQPGVLCCAKFKDGNYYRAKITSTIMLPQGCIEVLFIDYGNKDYIPIGGLRNMTKISASLISIPPQAREFILAGFTHAGVAWNDDLFEVLSNDIRYTDLEFQIVKQVGNYLLIALGINQQDICASFVQRGLGIQIPISIQQIMLQSMSDKAGGNVPAFNVSPDVLIQKQLQQAAIHAAPIQMPPMAQFIQQQPPSPKLQGGFALLTYKSLPLEPESEHPVYVSYVTDGPLLFAVQLKEMEEKLKGLMNDINTMPLCGLTESPLPGYVCLARSSEDDYICRAVVTNMVDGKFKVYYVDFGNTEVLAFDRLYQIPFKYVIPKVMATRFSLAGLTNYVVSLNMKCAFKDFVNNKILFMKVKPQVAGSVVELCELWDSTRKSALEIVLSAAAQSYSSPTPLTRGTNLDVKVSFVYGCKRFFVQPKNKEEELNSLMQRLQEVAESREQHQEFSLERGMPCIALYNEDCMYYRAEVISKDASSNCFVRYVDYGNEETVSVASLRKIDTEFITALRPQAIQCCLNGYQNIDWDEERDNILEELILERDFSMKIVEMQDDLLLVDLFDDKQYNVASLLLEKIAAKRSVASPVLLVQDSKRIEFRKKERVSPNEQQNDWTNKTDDYGSKRDSWRDKRNDNQSENDINRKSMKNTYNRSIRSDEEPWGNRSKISPESSGRDFKRRQRNEDFSENNGTPRSITSESWENSSKHKPDYPRGDYKKKTRNEFSGAEGDWNNPKFEDRTSYNYNKTTDSSQKYNRNTRNEKYSDYRVDYNKNKKWEGSEKSWSGSEKGYSQSKDQGYKKPQKFNNRENNYNKNNWNGGASGDTFENMEFCSSTDTFPMYEVVGTTENVDISWFHNPSHFYCQLESKKFEFEKTMKEIQSAYRKRKVFDAPVNSVVIAKFPEDKGFYRGLVLEKTGTSNKVVFVDYGNISLTNSVYQLEKKYLILPIQAYRCSINGIIPNSGSEWPQSDEFSSFFDKDSYQCNFLTMCDGVYNVELTNNGSHVAQKLIDSGLANKKEDVYSTFDISLLQCQQVCCKVASVNNLSDIILELEPQLFVNCCMHNLGAATQTFETNLQKYLLQKVIAYVDNVLDNMLEVTLYDPQGVKIIILEPDEGAIDIVHPFCSMPVFSQSITGYVSHATSTQIYIQSNMYAGAQDTLLDALYNHYNSTEYDAVEPVIDEFYAVHSEDANWYRGKVSSVEEEKVTVQYVDYGNQETVPRDHIRKLDSKFYEPHALALEILMENCEKLQDQEISISLTWDERGWLGTLTGPLVETILNDVTENVESVDKTKEEEIIIDVVPEQIASENQVGFSVHMSHFDNPGQFYLQLTDAEAAIAELQDRLQAEVNELNNVEIVSTGILCAAQYSVDQMWYRAQVLDADTDITTVRFIDFGNTDVLNSTSIIKTLPPELLAMEQHAKRCSLYLTPISSEWNSEACERFEALVHQKYLTAEIVHQDEKTTFVELYVDGLNVGHKLLEENLAVKLLLETSTSSTGFVSHLNSPSEFWIQLESACNDLEWVADQLTSANDYQELKDFAPGSLCAAVFPDDENWYRARILSNTVAGLEVLFIDYGNSCTCSSLRELPEDLVMLPPLAQKCCLQKPNGLLQWPDSATHIFKEISADGMTIFNVNRISQGETTVVQLLLESEDISARLMPQTFGGVIEEVESVNNFTIKNMNTGEIMKNCELVSLPGHDWSNESNQKFIELCIEGTTEFHVETVDSNLLRIFLNGIDIRLNLALVKSTPSSSVHSTPKKGGDYMKCNNTSPEKCTSIITPDEVLDIENDEKSVCESTVEIVLDEINNVDNLSTDDSKKEVSPDKDLNDFSDKMNDLNMGNTSDVSSSEETCLSNDSPKKLYDEPDTERCPTPINEEDNDIDQNHPLCEQGLENSSEINSSSVIEQDGINDNKDLDRAKVFPDETENKTSEKNFTEMEEDKASSSIVAHKDYIKNEEDLETIDTDLLIQETLGFTSNTHLSPNKEFDFNSDQSISPSKELDLSSDRSSGCSITVSPKKETEKDLEIQETLGFTSNPNLPPELDFSSDMSLLLSKELNLNNDKTPGSSTTVSPKKESDINVDISLAPIKSSDSIQTHENEMYPAFIESSSCELEMDDIIIEDYPTSDTCIDITSIKSPKEDREEDNRSEKNVDIDSQNSLFIETKTSEIDTLTHNESSNESVEDHILSNVEFNESSKSTTKKEEEFTVFDQNSNNEIATTVNLSDSESVDELTVAKTIHSFDIEQKLSIEKSTNLNLEEDLTNKLSVEEVNQTLKDDTVFFSPDTSFNDKLEVNVTLSGDLEPNLSKHVSDTSNANGSLSSVSSTKETKESVGHSIPKEEADKFVTE